MKFKITLMFFMFLGSQALALDLPVGFFQYSSTEAVSSKHFHQLYHNSSAERLLIEKYRQKKYICSRKTNTVTLCSKVTSVNPNNIDFQTDQLALISPLFYEQIDSVEEISKGDAVTVYEVEQKHKLDSIEDLNYQAYDLIKHGFYLDLNTDSFGLVRFKALNSNVLTRLSFEREKVSKREYYRHSLLSEYKK